MNVPVPSSNIRSDNDLHFSAWLDFFRWVAALLVVFTHVNNRFFVKILTLAPDERSLEQYGFAMISGFGRAAVMVFFVLSGFLVGGSALKRFQRTGTFDFPDYLIARLSRLWTVLLPSFVTAYIFNRIGIDILGGVTNGVYHFVGDNGDIYLAEGPLTFLCNAVFLQTVACYQYGENGALWSLFHEFWYYMVWPVCMIAIWGRVGSAMRAALLIGTAAFLLFLSAFQFAGTSVAAYFSIWLLGVVAATRTKPFLPTGPWVALGLFLVSLLAWRVFIPTTMNETYLSIQAVGDIVISFLFANVIVAFRSARFVPRPPFLKWHTVLAGFAFSLYCTHTPIVNAYASFLVAKTGMEWPMHPKGMGVTPYLYAFSAVALCVLFAWLFSLVTERHTNRVRSLFVQVRNRLLPKPQVG